ncbi:transglutaminase domain-containing protein [Paenibacillus herberti]|uniref:Transglutaminase-like domain-containing protein n=1 Tax=Paenibacillus herberti TaxID=1619309 RepID=A0A229NV98_9BACL|nr:transglutaminase domain-containing protein [Paenibacillus herberti]OXM13655.1 hypothetical protein CGZ75_21785 [Paenibacillus herberti]
MKHRMANLLLALSLAVSIYVVEARVNEPAQADRLDTAAVLAQSGERAGLDERLEAELRAGSDEQLEAELRAGTRGSLSPPEAGDESGTDRNAESATDASGEDKSAADASDVEKVAAGSSSDGVGVGNNRPAAETDLKETEGEVRSTIVEAGSSRAKLVDGLAKGFQSRGAEFQLTFRGEHEELVKLMPDLVQQALFQDDYTAYVLKSYSYKIQTARQTSTIRMKAEYRETPEQTAEVAEQSKAMLAKLVKPGMSDEEKVRAIHDWIVRHIRYDESLSRYTAYEAVELRSAVCQGYALLAYRMLSDAGLEVRIIEGTVESGDHAWNLVRLDGSWYHLDATWDDPLPDRGNEVSHKYYLLSDAEIGKDHQWTKDYPRAPKGYAD